MTPLEHNKYVGLSHLGYGVIHFLMTGVSMLFVAVVFSRVQLRDAPNHDNPMTFFIPLMIIAVIVNLVLTVPSFVAGYAFLKRKSWAKVMGIVAAVMAAMHVPFGTAAAVYTFWFLFSDPGKVLYGGSGQSLPPPPPSDWALIDRQKQSRASYVPPASPPDWRS